MYVLHFEPSDYAGIDFDKLEKLLNSISMIDINIDLKKSLENYTLDYIENVVDSHIDGKEYKTFEDVLNDKDKIYLMKYEAKKYATVKVRKMLIECLDILKNIVNTKICFNN